MGLEEALVLVQRNSMMKGREMFFGKIKSKLKKYKKITPPYLTIKAVQWVANVDMCEESKIGLFGSGLMDQCPPLVNKGWSPSTPLARCEGDCDKDSDCGMDTQGNYLKCCHRDKSEHIPTCKNRRSGDVYGMDYCVTSNKMKYHFQNYCK